MDALRVGVDASYAWEMTQGRVDDPLWRIDGEPKPIYPMLADAGADLLRVRLWTNERGGASLSAATDVARAGAAAGLEPHLVIFCSDEWSDVGKMPLAARWQGTSIDERCAGIEEHAASSVSHFIREGLRSPIVGLGNEVDFGYAGWFGGELLRRFQSLMGAPAPALGMPGQASGEAAKVLDALRTETWPVEARLLAACARGVRSADPDARLLLHISLFWEPGFCDAFYETISEHGVPFDVAALSYYPAAHGDPGAELARVTIEHLRSKFGVTTILPECAYPAQPVEGVFQFFRKPLTGFPLTEQGQADWLADTLRWTKAHPDVEGFIYWSPEFYPHPQIWGAMSLFDADGNARPALRSLGALRR